MCVVAWGAFVVYVCRCVVVGRRCVLRAAALLTGLPWTLQLTGRRRGRAHARERQGLPHASTGAGTIVQRLMFVLMFLFLLCFHA